MLCVSCYTEENITGEAFHLFCLNLQYVTRKLQLNLSKFRINCEQTSTCAINYNCNISQSI